MAGFPIARAWARRCGLEEQNGQAGYRLVPRRKNATGITFIHRGALLPGGLFCWKHFSANMTDNCRVPMV